MNARWTSLESSGKPPARWLVLPLKLKKERPMRSTYRPFYEGRRVTFTPVDGRVGVVVVDGVVIPGFLREGYDFAGTQQTYFVAAKQAA